MSPLKTIIGVFLFIGICHGAKIPGVLDLTVETIKTVPKENDFVLIYFYSSESKITKEFEQDFLNVVAHVTKKIPEVKLARMNMAVEIDLLNPLHVIELPMYMLFKHGKHYDFRGILNAKHVETWLEVALNKPLVVNSAKHLQELKDLGTLIIACFPGKSPSAGYEAYLKASEHFVGTPYMPLPRFAIVDSASAARELGLNKGTVTVFKHFEPDGKAVFSGDISKFDEFYKWVHREAEPIVYPYGHPEFHYVVASHRFKFRHILFMPSSARDFQKTFNDFKDAAKQFMRNSTDIDVLFMHVDTTKDHLKNALSFFHVNIDEDIPCNRITKSDEFHSRFVPKEKDFTVNGLVKFTKDVSQGRMVRTVRSMPIPDQWERFPVKELVGENYEEVTRNPAKMAFIFYYLPNDKPSERMIPVIEELGRRYRANSSVLIGQMDVSVNDGEIDIHYDLPNFKLITMDNKRIKYRGDRNVAAITTFIDSNGKLQIGAPPKERTGVDDTLEFLAESERKVKQLELIEEEERKRVWAKEDADFYKKIEALKEEHKLPDPEKTADLDSDSVKDAHLHQEQMNVDDHLREALSDPDDPQHEQTHIVVGYEHSYEL